MASVKAYEVVVTGPDGTILSRLRGVAEDVLDRVLLAAEENPAGTRVNYRRSDRRSGVDGRTWRAVG